MTVIQTSPYIRQQRFFPNDSIKALSVEMDRTYIDIATKINDRTIGLFALNKQVITGENWFLLGSTQNQQTLRILFTFTTTAPILHGIDFAGVSRFTRNFGEYTDGTNWYGLINGTSVAIAGQISFYVTPTQIIFVTGAGAPPLTSGNIVLEWLANF